MNRLHRISSLLISGVLVLGMTTIGAAEKPLVNSRKQYEPKPPGETTMQPQLLPPVSAERHFHVDDFAGLGPDYVPLQGSQSLWCGQRPDPGDCWAAPGYPSNSVQIFESGQLPVNDNVVNLDLLAAWSVEASYDHIYVDLKSDWHGWETTELPYTGSGALHFSTGTSIGGWVQIRFRVVSDDRWDGEDGLWTGPGSAIVIDSLVVSEESGVLVDYQNFEIESSGATSTDDGNWWVDDVYVVTNTADSGPGTLRDAINVTNANSSLNRIVFDIPGAGPHTIQPLSALPVIADYLYIDGFTQPGASPNTSPIGSPCDAVLQIELSGAAAGPGANGLFFQARGKVLGLAIDVWSGSAVKMQSNPVFVEGCYIGTNVYGVSILGISQGGINIEGDGCHVGGCSPKARNVIGGTDNGVVMDGNIEQSRIMGNYIGIGADLAAPIGNGVGVLISGNAHNNFVGSLFTDVHPAETNIFANNRHEGIIVDGIFPATNYFWGNSFHEDSYAIVVNAGNPPPGEIGVTAAEAGHVTGLFLGPPNATARLHFYRSTQCGGFSGTGYAETYIGKLNSNSGPTGLAPFDFTLPPVPPGCWITATVSFVNGPSIPMLNTSPLSACVQYHNTAAGTNVTVSLLDDLMIERGTVTFDQIESPGNTALISPFEPSVWLVGPYSVPDPQDPFIYSDITTDASYTGNVEVCLHYDEWALSGPEDQVVLLHFDGTDWVDVTTSRDAINNIVCGTLSSLSPFVIAVLNPTGVAGALVPGAYALHPSVPNPFNPVTTISYDIPAGGADVNISIYDVTGRLVRELVRERRPAGVFSVQWNGQDDRGNHVASGVYFYRMRAGEFVDTKKMVLLK